MTLEQLIAEKERRQSRENKIKELLLLIDFLPDMSIINDLRIKSNENNFDYSTKFKIIKILEKFN